MPYVFNGIEYNEVNDKEFEENAKSHRGYVVARRLFISLLKLDQTEVRNYYYPHLLPAQITIYFLLHSF